MSVISARVDRSSPRIVASPANRSLYCPFIEPSNRAASRCVTNYVMKSLMLLTLAAATAAPSAPPASQAEIVNSGSTNTLGYVLPVARSGALVVEMQGGAPPRNATIARAVADRFFAALAAAEPIAPLPTAHCMHSASFGYTLRIKYRGATTPDLTCPEGDREKELAALALEIAGDALAPNASLRKHPSPPPQSPSPSPSP